MTTLVATVGLSPAAVAHAVATLAPSRLVLVHTTASAAEADRIAAYAAPIRTDRIPVGPGVEFADTFRLLTDGLRGLIEPGETYHLDYTGGPKVLTACAVARHHADHDGGATALRSWVDDAHGLLRFGGDRPAVPTAGIELAALARLHGFTLNGHVVDGVHLEPDAHEVLAAVDAGDPERTRRWRAELVRRLDPRSLGAGAHPVWRDAAVSRGAAFEMAVAAVALTLGGIDELGIGLDPRDDAPGQLTDLDVVVRRRARVVVVEAKRRPSDLLPGSDDGRQAGDQMALARVVFGPAARTLLVTGPGVGRDCPPLCAAEGRIGESVARLVPTVPTDPRARGAAAAPGPVAHAVLRDRDGITATADILDTLLPAARAGRPPRRTPRAERSRHDAVAPPAEPGDTALGYGELVVPVSGTVLGVAASIRGVPATTVRLLGGAELCAAVERRLPAVVVDRLDRPIVPGADVEAGIPAGWLPAPGTGAVAVGPGPKRVTAALVVQALEHDLDLVHVGLDGQVRSWRHGRCAAIGRVGWAEHLADGMSPADQAGAIPSPVRAEVGRALRDRPGAEALVPARPEHVWLPDALVGFDARCAAFVAPADGRSGRARVRAVAAHLAQLVGDAATLFVLLPDTVADLDSWHRTARIRGWRVRTASRSAAPRSTARP